MTTPLHRSDTEAGVGSSAAPGVASVRDLHVSFDTRDGQVAALRGIDLEIAAGEIIAIVGESGSGKSVLASCLLGLPSRSLRTTTQGTVEVAGVDMLGGRDRDRRAVRRHLLGAVFQDPLSSLNPTMRIGRQLTERGISAARARRSMLDARVPDAERRLRQWPHQLSGGQRQRVMVAMALGGDGRLPGSEATLSTVAGDDGAPALIVADEPTTALDVSVQAQIVALFDRLRRDHGCAVVLVTHDLGVAASVADRILVMYAGQVCEVAAAAEVLRRPRHPYTRALLGARLAIDQRRPDRFVLAGAPPDPLAPPVGCAFAPRCPDATARCMEPPALLPTQRYGTGGEDRPQVACHHPLSTLVADAPAGPGEPRDRVASVSVRPRPTAAAASSGTPASGPAPALELCQVTKSFRVGARHELLHAVRGVDLRIPAGGAVALVGESGCGKTTLLRIATGLLTPDQGEVRWNGAPADGRATRPQLVFQDAGSSLTPWLTIGTQIAERLAARGIARSARAEQARELLRQVGLDDRAGRARPRQLSGGQRQRAAIARALACDPTLLICDEPVSALDASLAARVLDLLDELRERVGVAILLVTHDLAVARRVGDDVAVMYLGSIVEQADAEHLFERPLHPYTQGLLAAVPTTEPGRLAPTLEGEPPSPLQVQPGCAFANRCPQAVARCHQEVPILTGAGAGRVEVACHVALTGAEVPPG